MRGSKVCKKEGKWLSDVRREKQTHKSYDESRVSHRKEPVLYPEK